ncbi:MAG: sel1 repeat family protein, partial [Clostridia bacterium]|nr:sel1 repeat family protein [Clostridia bacterium]
ARLYEKGLGVERSYHEAILLYRDAAWEGNTDAQFALGFLYETGTGMKKSYPAALRWYRVAYHENGDACFRIGLFYEFGRGVTKSWEKAMQWYRLAVKKGNVEALFRLGVLTEKKVNPPDYKSAAALYEQAANENFAPAQKALARLYEKGLGVEKSKEKAAYWLKRAKEKPIASGEETGDDE